MGTTWTLSEIRTKVRNLSGRPSTNQLTNDNLDDYINHFYMEDLIANLDLEELSSQFTINTTENVERYTNVPENFALSDTAYVNGDILRIFKDFDTFYSEFGREYTTRETAATGDGSTNPLTGTLNNTPVAPENITFDDDTEIFTVQNEIPITSITNASPAVVTTAENHLLTSGDKVRIGDIMPPLGFEPTEGDKKSMSEINNNVTTVTKVTNTTFQLDNTDTTNFSEYVSGGKVYPISIARLEGDRGGTGSVTLSTGAFSLSFNTTVTSGQDVRANYESLSTGEPAAALLFGRSIFVRPVPDGTYNLRFVISGRPTPLESATDSLANNDWGKYIAYGAAIDILNDHGQHDAANKLEPQFERLRAQIEWKRIRNFDDQRAIPRF